MKGIILAGGKGTRLYPMTKCVSKQLLPIYDKPMIYYSLSVFLSAEIREVLLISTPEAINNYIELLGDGSNFGMRIEYKVQEQPKGIAQAFLLGEEFIGGDSVCLMLGDNIFFGQYFSDMLIDAKTNLEHATIFGYPVNDPRQFGVVEFDDNQNVVSLEEKPEVPKSNYAIPGLYFYDNSVVEIAKNLKPSARGELEITAINNEYLSRNQLKVKLFGRGMAWLDTGSPENMLKASEFIEAVQSRQGFYIACLEEMAYRNGWITKEQLLAQAEKLKMTEYGKYLSKIAKEN